MRAFFDSLIGYFLTPGGLVLMAALDSSLVFFLPLGIDLVVVLLSAREPELFWLYGCWPQSGRCSAPRSRSGWGARWASMA
jgi:hypothetical protein